MQVSGEFIKRNIDRCLERIANAAVKNGRDLKDITLVAVSKTVSPEAINIGIKAGIKIIGENKVQEARNKKPLLDPVELHLVGHLQTNKVKYAIEIFNLIHSVDSVHLAEEINKQCEKKGSRMPVLIEVNTSGESSKYGCLPEETIDLVYRVSQFPYIQILGLMTIGLFTDKIELVRPCFTRLRELAEVVSDQKIDNVRMEFLSMGMSSDFEVAIEEGSNMVRIGTAIFGPRCYSN
jgi:pyridoxal phosphate enzyme (YggS family)